MDCYQAKPKDVVRKWWLVNADGQVLGRLAVRIARILMGKTKPTYTPHIDTGDCVVVYNASKVKVTGDKLDDKVYQRYSGYPGGLKEIPMRELLARHPDDVIRLAVRRMLPKSRLGKKMLLKLKIHEELPPHAYKAQKVEPLPAVAGK